MVRLALVATATFILVVLGTGALLRWLRKRRILDIPNARSSHVVPTPRGGGLAVASTIILMWGSLAATGGTETETAPMIGLATVLMGFSWQDDRKGLSALLRFLVHIATASTGVLFLGDGLVFQGLLPFSIDRAATIVLWVWFLNVYNFMDGIDGITGVETIALGIGLALLAGSGEAGPAVAVAAAGLGFLVWNWHPAKIFLGDSGSIPLGFLLGWLLLTQASRGHWAAALILPSYYLADAGLTLLLRAVRGEKVLQPHRRHFYQQAVQGGASHAWVACAVLGTDTVLVALALLSLAHPWIALAGATLTVSVLLRVLQDKARNGDAHL